MTCEFAHFDGAYVLGALSPSDRIAFERHLPTCADCTRAVQELAGIPGLLGRVSPDSLGTAAEAEPMPETLLPGLVRRMQQAQRRRRRILVAVAAAAVVAVSAGAVAVASVVDDDSQVVAETSTPSEPPQRMKRVADVPIEATVSLTSVDWGTRVELVCAYKAWGEDAAEWPYDLVISTGSGREEHVASWKALPGRETTLQAATATQRGEIRSVEVRTADGRPVLQLDL